MTWPDRSAGVQPLHPARLPVPESPVDPDRHLHVHIGSLMSDTQDALYGIELAAARLWHDVRPLAAAGRRWPAAMPARWLARLRLRHAAWTPAAGPLPLRRLRRWRAGCRIASVSTRRRSTRMRCSPRRRGGIVLNLLLLAADSLPAGRCRPAGGSAGRSVRPHHRPGRRLAAGPGALPRRRRGGAFGLDGARGHADGGDRAAGACAGCRLSVLMSPRPGRSRRCCGWAGRAAAAVWVCTADRRRVRTSGGAGARIWIDFQ